MRSTIAWCAQKIGSKLENSTSRMCPNRPPVQHGVGDLIPERSLEEVQVRAVPREEERSPVRDRALHGPGKAVQAGEVVVTPLVADGHRRCERLAQQRDLPGSQPASAPPP